MSTVRWGWKTSIAGLAALLALGLAACGGGSSSAPTGSSSVQAEGKPNREARTGAENGGDKGDSETPGKPESGGDESATSFKPKRHHDSGGGSTPYRVQGGDNSIQNFGAEAEGSEFEQVAAALHDFLDARAVGDWAAACSYMSKSVVESFERLAAQAKQTAGASCAKVVGELTSPAAKPAMKAEAAKANVRSLRIEGERAFLIYTGDEKTVLAMPMTHEGGAWKVASLVGTPIS
jgi:hypothetical protein